MFNFPSSPAFGDQFRWYTWDGEKWVMTFLGVKVPPAAPVNIVLPVISGLPNLDATLTATTGTWTGIPDPILTYQWKRDGADIPGATTNTYLLGSSDIGKVITFAVTASNFAGDATATSIATAMIVGGAPFLDGIVNLTGAWSLSRNMLTSFSSTRYTKHSGVLINALKDQSGNSRDLGNSSGVGVMPSEATAFPAGVLCADFDGVDDYINGASLNSFFSTTNGAMVVSVIIDSATRNEALAKNNHLIMADDARYLGLSVGNVGGVITFYAHNRSFADHSVAATPGGAVGTPYVLMWRHFADTIYASVNGGAETSTSSGVTSGGMSNGLHIGGASSDFWCNMKIAEAFTTSDGSQTTALAAAIADMLAHVKTVPPTSITGLVGWWDASVASSFSLTGASINSVADQSGSGNTMNWLNAKPIYSATGINTSFPAIIFTGSSALSAASFPIGAGDTLTAWAVCTLGDAGTNQYGRVFSYTALGQSQDYNNIGSFAINRNTTSTTQLAGSRNSSNFYSPTSTAHPAAHRVIYTVDSSGVNRLYIDGVLGATSTSAGNWVTGGTLAIGDSPTNSQPEYWVGPIAEVGVATSYSDATTVAGLDLYLKNKWGL